MGMLFLEEFLEASVIIKKHCVVVSMLFVDVEAY